MNPDATLSPVQATFAYGALIALFLGTASFFWKRENRLAHRLFAGTMFFLTIMLASGARRAAGHLHVSNFPYEFIHLWGVLGLLLGPMIYFYVRTSVDAGFLFKRSSLLHGIPALIHLSLLLPVWLVGPEIRPAFINTYLDYELYRSFIPGIRTGFVSCLIYATVSFIWIRRLEKHVQDVAAFSDESSIRWLKWYAGLFVLFFFCIGFATPGTPHIVTALTAAVFVSALLFSILVRPQMVYGIATELKLQEQPREDEKYAASTLTPDQKRTYIEKLLGYVEQEKPYLKQDLTLKDVAMHTRIPDRYLSQIVNEELGKHFRDFINGYRVNYARTLLVDHAQSHLSIDGVAEESGFKSRSAFYEAFKRSVGTTPGAFRTASATA